jgi:signal transduction histidine kinase
MKKYFSMAKNSPENNSAMIDEIKSKLSESQKELQVKEEHFYLLTQDLIEPLETLTGFFQIMYHHASILTPVEIKEFSTRMDISVKHLLIIIQNLLEWSKVKKGESEFKPETINIYKAVKESLSFFDHIARKKNIIISVISDEDLNIVCDYNMLDFIIRNLISNSIKFSPEGSPVDIFIKRKNEFAEIKVIDEGMGISREQLENLFNPDYHFTTLGTNNEKGTGYAMYPLKKFVEYNSGSIRVHSEQHKGTSVTVKFPLIEPSERSSE